MLGMLLSHLVKIGTLTVYWPDGGQSTYGSGLPKAAMRIHGRFTPLRLALRPDLAFGEAYMDGKLVPEDGDIAGILDILVTNMVCTHLPFTVRLWRGIRRWFKLILQFNPASRSRRNVAHHYDLSSELYDLFLDRDRQYSCAYFPDPNTSLDDAQIAKKRHIAAKLNLDRPNLKVLDIGCGWGGLALDLARDGLADVLGITLSTEQLALASKRAADAGLEQHCRFELQDYRKVEGAFDRVVSVGMFEHVGVGHYRTFFDRVCGLLSEDGIGLIHTIGRSDGPGSTNAWIAKYIFPGGYTPALSEILPAIERAGLVVTDIEVLRLHYAETLKSWRERFRGDWAKAAALYDERFCRMWDFYLAGSELAFRRENLVVFQVQVARRNDSLPIVRDYMLESERTMRFAGIERMPRATEAA
jgi:cyclopropane-fatty-acyl-phospholipid synthase